MITEKDIEQHKQELEEQKRERKERALKIAKSMQKNSNAQKWDRKKVIKNLSRAFVMLYTEDKYMTNARLELELGLPKKTFSYWIGEAFKSDDDIQNIYQAIQNFREDNLCSSGLDKTYDSKMTEFLLKHNYNYGENDKKEGIKNLISTIFELDNPENTKHEHDE